MEFSELAKVAAIGAELAMARREEAKARDEAFKFYARPSSMEAIEGYRRLNETCAAKAMMVKAVEMRLLDAWSEVKP
jgi:hypothetical protein